MTCSHLAAELCRLWPTMPEPHVAAIVERFATKLPITDGRCTVVLTAACAKPQGMRPVKDVAIEALENELRAMRPFRYTQPKSDWVPPPVSASAAEKARIRREAEKAAGLGVNR